jgi:hypothetical protein
LNVGGLSVSAGVTVGLRVASPDANTVTPLVELATAEPEVTTNLLLPSTETEEFSETSIEVPGAEIFAAAPLVVSMVSPGNTTVDPGTLTPFTRTSPLLTSIYVG